jgi:hypothetical protein
LPASQPTEAPPQARPRRADPAPSPIPPSLASAAGISWRFLVVVAAFAVIVYGLVFTSSPSR